MYYDSILIHSRALCGACQLVTLLSYVRVILCRGHAKLHTGALLLCAHGQQSRHLRNSTTALG